MPEIPDGELAYKDAVFISPHKFVGGPGTPGVLIAKRALLDHPVPAVPAGGTVSYVSPSAHAYHPEPEVREEGGTPGIVESIRAGLVFALKEAVGCEEVGRREHRFARRALRSWGANPRIEILGDVRPERLAIISFGLRHGRGYLHGLQDLWPARPAGMGRRRSRDRDLRRRRLPPSGTYNRLRAPMV